MTAPGDQVRTLVDLLANDGSVFPPGTFATVIGYQGSDLVLEVHDREADIRRSAVAAPWDVTTMKRAGR